VASVGSVWHRWDVFTVRHSETLLVVDRRDRDVNQ
jgi:hypothetical protein